MKSSLFFLISVAIIFVAIFGVFSMNGMMEHGRDCWVTTTNGVACSESMSPLDYINFHFKAFEKFSLTVFQDTSSLSLTFLLVILLFTITKVFILKEVFIRSALRSIFRFANLIFKLSYSKFNYWLSLLENSPSFAYKA